MSKKKYPKIHHAIHHFKSEVHPRVSMLKAREHTHAWVSTSSAKANWNTYWQKQAGRKRAHVIARNPFVSTASVQTQEQRRTRFSMGTKAFFMLIIRCMMEVNKVAVFSIMQHTLLLLYIIVLYRKQQTFSSLLHRNRAAHASTKIKTTNISSPCLSYGWTNEMRKRKEETYTLLCYINAWLQCWQEFEDVMYYNTGIMI